MAGELAINWGLLQPVDIGGAADAYTQARNSKLAREAQQQQIDLATKQNARVEKADARDDAFRSQITSAIDPATGQIDPLKAHQAYLSVGDLNGAVAFDKNAREAVAAKIDQGVKKINATAQLLGGVTDQATLDAARAQAAPLGIDPKDLPAVYTPDAIHQLQVQGLDAKGQLEKAHQDQLAKLDQAKFEYQQKHDKDMLGIQQGQLAVSQGQLGVAKGQLGVAQANASTNAGRLAVEKTKAAGALLDPQSVTAMASQALQGDKSVFSGLGRSPQNQALVRAEIVKQGRALGLTPAQIGTTLASANAAYVGQTAAARSVGTITGKVDYGSNELSGAIPLALAASKALPRGNFVPFTKAQQMIAAGNSDPALKDFVAKTNALKNAYNLTAGRAGTSVEERHTNNNLIDTATGPEAYEAVTKAMQQEAAVARAASKQTMNDVTGKSNGESSPSPSARPVRVTGDADYNKIPSGQAFIGPDGKRRIKP